MTSAAHTPLSELERDALAELSNIAMARAATSLRKMVQHEVRLSVPAVEILERDAAARLMEAHGSSTFVAVRQDFTGAFAGRALLIFPGASSLELIRAVVGTQLSIEDIADLEDESLAETGNIILNSWVATIANLLKRGLQMSLPVVVRGAGRQILASTDANVTLVLFLHIQFEIRKQEIEGFVALLMDVPSIDELRSLIADFVVNAIHKK